jgi:protein-L-isoaspartate(D-aspartate) O-methyltransferase
LTVTETLDASEDADALREAMVDRLVANGVITTARLEAAMRQVPRHLFAPGVELVAAYADDVVRYRHDEHGVCLSSVSAPWMQAAMIEAAQITEGMRVLEIGSGGYNAALLSRLVGPAGQVTSVDIDPEAIARASDGLQAAGIDGVELVLADAEHGVEHFAPFDRIIVTVATWDLPPAWMRQLAEDGHIVLPLALRGQQRIIAFDRDGEDLAGHSMFYGGFVPMQGIGAHRAFALAFEDATTLHFDEGEPADTAALSTLLAHVPVTAETGVTVVSQEPYDSLQLFLAVTLPATATLVFGSDGAGHGLPAPQAGFPAFADGRGTIAYLTMRTHGQGGAARYEFVACALGPAAQAAAERLRDLVREWDTTLRPDCAHPQITLIPAARETMPGPHRYTLRKAHTTVVVTYPETPVPASRSAHATAFSGSPA